MNYCTRNKNRGMSIVEVIIAIAIMALVFGGLLAFFQTAVKLIGSSKSRAGAVALANERLEYLRSLPYASVGTLNGIPAGNIPQNSTTTLNGVTYNERILIEYFDSPDDGEGAADVNGILADYKRAKVEYSWDDHGETASIALITNIIPVGIESTDGGGTVTVNVFNALANPIAGASVRLYNDTATTVDVTRFTNESGIAQFAGAPAAANYQIFVSNTGMSSDQTHQATSTNPNPTTPPIAVVESQVSTMNFQIDYLSNLAVNTVGLPTIESFSDSFDNGSQVATSTNTTVGGGEVVLAGSPSYVSSGTVLGTSTTPSPLSSWDVAEFSVDTPASTAVSIQLYSVSGSTYTLIPDVDLPGNSTGFATGTINISGLSTTTYPTLALGAALSTSDASTTPRLLDWNLDHVVSEPPIGNVDFTLTGSKTIGTTASSTPVYKYEESHTTDSDGYLWLPGLEWDSYSLSLNSGAYTIYEACQPLPYALNPNLTENLKLTLISTPTYSLQVYITDIGGNTIAGATATLTRTGFNESQNTSACGQTFFSTGLTAANDYSLNVTAPGYTSTDQTDIEIDGNNTITVTLSPA